MTDIGTNTPQASHQTDEQRRKPVRKSQPAMFTHRITFSVAPDQVQTLAQAKRIYRASEAFVLRLAWDNFCRANNLTAELNNGAPNGR